MLSQRYTGCQALSWGVTGRPVRFQTQDRPFDAQGKRSEPYKLVSGCPYAASLQTAGKRCILPVLWKGLNAWQ